MYLLPGSSNSPLAKKVASLTGWQIINRDIKNFADGEIKILLKNNKISGRDVTILQTLSNSNQLVELCLLIDAVKAVKAKKISIIIPYLFYSRQDKPKIGEPFSPNVIIKILENSGVHDIICLDLHSESIQKKFSIPIKHLEITTLFKKIIQGNCVIVAPDAGGTKRAEAVAQHYKLPLLHMEKKRLDSDKVSSRLEESNIQGKDCFIVDDIIATGNTLCEAANILHRNGAKTIQAFCTHAVLSGNALDNIQGSKLEKLFITNSINAQSKVRGYSKISIIDIAELISDTLRKKK